MTWRMAGSEMVIQVDGGALHTMVVCQQTHPLSHAHPADVDHRPPARHAHNRIALAAQRLLWA